MRIGIIGQIHPDSFATNIKDALSAMGHDPVALCSSRVAVGSQIARVATTIRNALPYLDERVQLRIANAALHTECEIVINVEQRIMPAVVRQLKRNGIRIGIWFPDHVANMGRQNMLLAPYDAVFVKEPHLVKSLHAILDLPVFYLPQACNSRWHRPLATSGTEPYLVLAGNMYPSRILLLERLLASGIPLKVYGGGFPRWVGDTPVRGVHAGQCVWEAEKARVFRSATAVLNTMHPAEIDGVNLRLFEAAGCGAAVLTEFRPTLPELFAVGSEVLAFRDFSELVLQAKQLLHNDGLSAKLGNAAATRAHNDHTYEKRLEIILERLS